MGILKSKTVDSIVAAFTKTISELEAVEQANQQQETAKREQAASLNAEANGHAKEAGRARKIATNLKGLLAG